MKYDRTERISEEIKKALSSIIMYELKDPGITGMISVTGVNTTKDLSYSKVYISVFGSEEQKKSSFAALKSSVKFIRRSLSTKVKLRHTPELLFELDSSLEYGMHMNEVLSKISTKNRENQNEEISEVEDSNND